MISHESDRSGTDRAGSMLPMLLLSSRHSHTTKLAREVIGET